MIWLLYYASMRAYFFSNMYLNGIQHGIQAGHALGRIWLEYTTKKDRKRLKMLQTFTSSHETWVILNGGDSDALHELRELFRQDDNPYPWHYFTEPGLGNALTSVGIIVPEKLYSKESDQINFGDQEITNQFTFWEINFIQKRLACPLAR